MLFLSEGVDMLTHHFNADDVLAIEGKRKTEEGRGLNPQPGNNTVSACTDIRELA